MNNKFIPLLLVLMLIFIQGCSQAETIAIGYQSPTSQIWSALIIKNTELYENLLLEEFPNKEFEIVWLDYPSGPPITNNMIAGNIQIGFMGDMPLLVNGFQGQSNDNYDSILLAMDGKGKDGKNQAILTNKDSNIKVLSDLKGKSVSVPFGSSAHRMLLEILKKNSLLEFVDITNQDVTVGMSSVENNLIPAHATWDPYPRFMLSRNQSNVIADGSESEADYLNGVVIDNNWAKENERYAVIFAKALLKSHQLIIENPEIAAEIFSEESGFPVEICLEEAKEIRWDTLVYVQDVETLKKDAIFLESLGKMGTLDFDHFIEDRYLKSAYLELDLIYPTKKELSEEW
jgi:NitT/TauT family transport system substrate-binding protein